MSKIEFINPKYGAKAKKTAKFLTYLTRLLCSKKLIFLLKLIFFILFIWFCGYFFMSSHENELLNEFKKEKMNIKYLQEKLSNLVAGDRQQFAALVDEKIVNEKTEIKLDDGITPEARQFMKELGLENPGEDGKPVELPSKLSEDIKKRIKKGYETYGYNAFVSSMVSLNRKIPDIRSEECKNKTYTNLPKCSVIIPFHNDDWMVLMRTVHSVLIRSPPELLEEVLLVDDASDREHLQKPLEEYVKKYPKIKLVRAFQRLGIISNRMLGAVNAIGPIIVYLDSHVEVAIGWLEPILDRFSKDKNVLVWSKISSVDKDSLATVFDNNRGDIGGFQWNMNFDWLDIKQYEGDHPTAKWDPKRSPTIMGPAHAISKSFFKHVGMLDPEFGIWGGEDVELSFKAWMCGGKVEYVPCSQVAHMYKGHTYTFPSDKGDYRWNTDRIAEIWLDEYKRYYYRLAGDTKDRDFGNITERLEIKKRANCKPFSWFIENVHPNVPIPDKIKDPPIKNEKNDNKKKQ